MQYFLHTCDTQRLGDMWCMLGAGRGLGGVPLLPAAGQEVAQVSLQPCFVNLHFCGLCAGQVNMLVGQKQQRSLWELAG